jgi:osmotically-inducible protein OsmY
MSIEQEEACAMDRRSTLVGGILGGITAGAGLMYFLDPDRGKRRRAGVRDKVTASLNGVGRAACGLSALSRDARNRAYGLVAEARGMLRREAISDETLEARVRSRMGHKIPHPEWVEVKADHGCVTLSGKVPASDAAALVSCVSGVRGVTEVANHAEVQ